MLLQPKEIKELIEDSAQKVKTGSGMVEKSGKTLEEIVQGVQHVTEVVGEISTAANEQSLGINQVHQAMEIVQSLTNQNSTLAERRQLRQVKI